MCIAIILVLLLMGDGLLFPICRLAFIFPLNFSPLQDWKGSRR